MATTAQVDISAVSVNSYNNHVAPSSFRRLLSFRHLLSTSTEVSFFIQTTDYQTASAIGIRLKPVYMTEDGASDDTGDDACDDIGDDASDDTGDNACDDMGDDASEDVPNDTCDDMADDASDDMADDASVACDMGER